MLLFALQRTVIMPRRSCRGAKQVELKTVSESMESLSHPKDADTDRLPTENEIWYIIKAIIGQYGCVRHQIESFNAFISQSLPHIVEESSEIRVPQGEHDEHVVSLCNLSVSRPTITDSDGIERDLFPHMARARSLSYSSAVLVDVAHDIYKKGERVERRLFREVCLCRLPIMVGSQCCHTQHNETPMECRLDQGGYFIVSGGEKVLVAQEKLHHNTPYVFQVKQPSRFALQCEIRSCHERKLRSTSSLYVYITNAKKGSTPEMVVTLPFVSMYIPVLALFRLLGVGSREEAMEAIVGDHEASESRLLCSILDNDSTADMSAEALYEYIGREGTRETTKEKRQRYLDHIINCECLPHQGLTQTPEVLRAKALYLGIMLRKMIRVYTGELKCDDRDHYAAKRVDCSGTQFALLFRQVFRGTQKSLTTNLHRAAECGKLEFTNVGNLVAGKKLTQAFRFALATGNWGILSMRGNTAQSGVAQQLGRMTSTSTLSLLRKVSTPISRETKNPKPRQLHYTSWGLTCPMDTPEGSGCGLTKSLAMSAHIRVGTFSTAACEQLDILQMCVKGIHVALTAEPFVRRNGVPILVNGCLYMYAESPQYAVMVAKELRELRRAFVLPFDTTVAINDGILHIDTDAGCLLRPLLRVDRLKQLHKVLRDASSYENIIDVLMQEQCLEYVDKQEEESLRVALYSTREPEQGTFSDYTHAELDPSFTIPGLCGACSPFADYNQAPRNTYQSAMMKQALGVYTLNYPVRMDTVAHALVQPQRPIVSTRIDSIIGASDAPTGVNALVVIKCYTGRNQEDSIIMNQAALDRGMFRSVKYQTYRDEERHSGGADSEKFENISQVTQCAGRRDANYEHLEDSGIAAVGTPVRAGDVIIGKTVTTTELGEGARRAVKRDKSTVLKHESGIVDAVLHATNRDGTDMVKVRVRSTRTPMVGDKFCVSQSEHEVLTLRGWVMIEDVTPQDHAMTLDPMTGTMAYEKVLETHAFDCKDELMYEIDSQQVSLKTTLTHRMWVKKRDSSSYDFAYAKDIVGKRVSYLKNCPQGLDPSQVQHPPVPIPNKDRVEDWLFFFGFWMGDGCCHTTCQSVYIAQRKTETRQHIVDVSHRLGLHFKGEDYDTDKSINLVYCKTKNPELCAFLLPLSVGALNKYLPSWCLHLSVDHSRAVLAGLLASDGSSNMNFKYFGRKATYAYYTSSPRLRDDVQTLALNCGMASNVSVHTPEGYESTIYDNGLIRTIVSNGTNYRVSIVDRKCRPTVNHGHVRKQRRQTETIKPYTGSVHCITVRTGVFYIRRKGVACWTGNSSRMGQKGVIGAALPHEDMPFTSDGMVPDIIVNPHAIPSRMTIGQLNETLLSILCTYKGTRGDGTMFRGTSIEYMCEQLEQAGYNRHGRVKLHNGFTGEEYEGLAFMGPTYYQRLRHMAHDKDHARARGPVQMLSRQPTEGRARDGGLRFGEMERDCVISHGASELLKDRLLDNSDPSVSTICGKCGLLAQPAAESTHVRHKEAQCRNCENGKCVKDMRCPHAFRLMLHELMAMNIAIRFEFNDGEA